MLLIIINSCNIWVPKYISMSSLNRPSGLIQSLSYNVHELCVCVSVPSQKTRFSVDWRLLVIECSPYIGIPLKKIRFFALSMFFCVLRFFQVFGSIQISLLCVSGELAGGGFLAVGVSDK